MIENVSTQLTMFHCLCPLPASRKGLRLPLRSALFGEGGRDWRPCIYACQVYERLTSRTNIFYSQVAVRHMSSTIYACQVYERLTSRTSIFYSQVAVRHMSSTIYACQVVERLTSRTNMFYSQVVERNMSSTIYMLVKMLKG